MTNKLTFKIASPVVLAGFFIIVVFMALHPTQFDLTFYIVLSLLGVFIFFYGFASGQRVTLPVRKLLKKAIELSRGDLKTRFYLEAKDEFGELAGIFNKIAEELEANQAQKENTEQSVNIKVRAKTQQLEETIDALEQKVKNRTIELERFIQESEKLQQEAKTKEIEVSELRKKLGTTKLRAPKPALNNENEVQ